MDSTATRAISSTSWHESAHAVAAQSLGLPLVYLSIRPREDSSGRARFDTATEGFAKAEVTVGGVDTRELDSRTMMSRMTPGLYFIGEVVDVTFEVKKDMQARISALTSSPLSGWAGNFLPRLDVFMCVESKW